MGSGFMFRFIEKITIYNNGKSKEIKEKDNMSNVARSNQFAGDGGFAFRNPLWAWDPFWHRSGFLSDSFLDSWDKLDNGLTLGVNNQTKMNMLDDGENLIVKVQLSGVPKDDFTATIYPDRLVVEGETKSDSSYEVNYLHKEFFSSKFSRVISLPENLDVDEATTSYEDGVLVVTIPKLEGQLPSGRRLEIE